MNSSSSKYRKALFFKSLSDDLIQCQLCPHYCRLKQGESGICRTRKNDNNAMRLLTYAQVNALNIDPMEKKPLYHFLPGQPVLSLGNNGCNLQCDFCQNWQLSQTPLHATKIMPEDVVALAKIKNVRAVAFTYAEPMVWYEYVLDTSKLLKKNNIKVVLVSNGMVNEEPFLELRHWIDAINIDIKSIDQDFYTRLCKGYLKPILKTCVLASSSCHVEVTNLVIPGENDSEHHFHELAKFIRNNMGINTVLHISRYHPAYKMQKPATPEQTITKALAITREYLNFVYPGNLHSHTNNNTCCPKCSNVLINRSLYSLGNIKVSDNGACSFCGYNTGIVLS